MVFSSVTLHGLSIRPVANPWELWIIVLNAVKSIEP